MDEQNAAHSWSRAGDVLGIRVVAPFVFQSEMSTFECIAWLPDSGGGRGILLLYVRDYDVSRDATAFAAKREGHTVSVLNVAEYKTFNRSAFVDALLDWGFTGPMERKPT